MRSVVFFLCLVSLCLVSSTDTVVAAEYDFSVSSGYLRGESSYQIGGHYDFADGRSGAVHFPLSELIFPLDAVMLKGELDVAFADSWQFSLSAQTNLSGDTGTQRDSDWLSPGRLDIYSESDTEMRARLFEGKLRYRFYRDYFGNPGG